jgi:hypothetical protein
MRWRAWNNARRNSRLIFPRNFFVFSPHFYFCFSSTSKGHNRTDWHSLRSYETTVQRDCWALDETMKHDPKMSVFHQQIFIFIFIFLLWYGVCRKSSGFFGSVTVSVIKRRLKWTRYTREVVNLKKNYM